MGMHVSSGPIFLKQKEEDWQCMLAQGYSSSKKKKELPYNPGIPPLGIYLKEILSRRDVCTPMSIAALFTIAKIWKQSKCLSRDEWMKKTWDIYTMEYFSALKKMDILPFVTT
uniref:Uncharacterized protein n=1 Tax=Equus caballus TaxID=9796 RepID=A0A9L0TE59_HORSE